MRNELFQMLQHDHVEVKRLLGQLKETKATAVKKRGKLFQELRAELVPHMKAEERTFYSPLLSNEAAREVAMEAVEEHHVSEMVLRELAKMSKGEERWGAKLGVFKELVEHHIQEEESTVFTSAEKAFDRGEIHNILKRFEQEKQRIKTKLK